jgi:hypothetical protein
MHRHIGTIKDGKIHHHIGTIKDGRIHHHIGTIKDATPHILTLTRGTRSFFLVFSSLY